MRHRLSILIALVTLFVFTATSASAAQRPLDAAELQLALKKLTVVGSALYVAAHPDDENTAMIAWLSRDRLVRTGYLSMTRGDGGQNLLGGEKGELLGVIRTQELLAARRIDGSEQYFTRAIDFGYSKNPTETLAIWGHDTILADVVWNIRRYQPDVLITRFPTTGEGGHGHHTASAILAGEAFKAAEDPTRFPEQLRWVSVWQPRRLYWNRFSFTQLDPNDPKLANSYRVDLGAFNPVLGRAYTEIAADSRSMHKSQGFGAAERRGTNVNYFDLLAGDPPSGDPKTADLLGGIDMSWARFPDGMKVGTPLEKAYQTFDPQSPEKSIPLLLTALDELDRVAATPGWKGNPWVAVKRDDILDAIRGCAGLAIDADAADSSVTQEGDLPVTVTVVNRSGYPFVLSMVASLYANPGKSPGVRLENNVPVKTELSLHVPAFVDVSQPYWLVAPPSKGTYQVKDQTLIGLPENPAPLQAIVTLTDPKFHTLIFRIPVVRRWTDAVRGEQTRRADVVPPVTLNHAQRVYLFPDARPRQTAVNVHDYVGAATAAVRLEAPAGWSVEPASIPVTFDAKDADQRVTFTVTPPKGETAGVLTAIAEIGQRTSTSSVTNVDYPHIPAQRVFSTASAKLIREDVKKVGTKIGYIMGAGDDVPDALRQMGYDVTLLTDTQLDAGDFAGFDAIVAGVRAYNARPAMRNAHPKLMQYVENGGTLVVQYNSLNPQPLLVKSPGPYPFRVTDARVTVEDAPIRILTPDSPLLNTPNKITPADFEGWVQERGVYFTQDWDPRYTTVMASNDPGEPERAGGELYTRYGKGVFIYTGYAWFRQLPAGVPGAYKLFANLVSAR